MVQKKSYAAGISIVGGLFFVLGFITWLNATLVPYLKVACELSNFEAYFVTAAFYGAYVAMLLPAAQVLQRSGLKNGLTIGLMSLLAGVLIFIPAAQLRRRLLQERTVPAGDRRRRGEDGGEA
ncbi:MAG: hypothetical protein LBS63_05880 [Prevotellaceae bacterium]|jgi:fucose permease|nr:hypothetical protein [Prevotellaceae bacterium]